MFSNTYAVIVREFEKALEDLLEEIIYYREQDKTHCGSTCVNAFVS